MCYSPGIALPISLFRVLCQEHGLIERIALYVSVVLFNCPRTRNIGCGQHPSL